MIIRLVHIFFINSKISCDVIDIIVGSELAIVRIRMTTPIVDKGVSFVSGESADVDRAYSAVTIHI
ncbi:MAG: hypothetical protein JRE57_10440 [Deltaproteobacteria bacterium]|nr:hypothetical protein [Deltaproteobacteria bacterium]